MTIRITVVKDENSNARHDKKNAPNYNHRSNRM